MRPLLLSLVTLAGCYAPTGPHDTMNPVGIVAQGLVDFAAAQAVGPVVQPVNGCLPIDHYVGGATYLISRTPTGCEWIAYNEAGGEIAHGVVPIAGS